MAEPDEQDADTGQVGDNLGPGTDFLEVAFRQQAEARNQSSAAAQLEVPGDGDDPDGEDSEDGEATGDGADATSETDTPSPEAELGRFVDSLIDNPKAITTIPRGQQAAVVDAMQEKMVAATHMLVQQAYQEGLKSGKQQVEQQRQMETLDALLEQGDIAAFREEAKNFPGGEKNYHRVKADLEPTPAGSMEHYQERTNRIFSELGEYPEAQAELRANWNYRATDDDLIRLSRDVGAALERAKASRVRRDPDVTALQKRSDAAAGRKAIPKPDASSGTAGGGGTRDISKITNVSDLFDIAFRQDLAKKKTG